FKIQGLTPGVAPRRSERDRQARRPAFRKRMNDPALAESLARAVVSADEALEQEFEARLRDSGTLAFRVAYGVLRHREDAEDVAQESLAKAYRCFRQLRNRERFRSRLVPTTWRMALDWRRGHRRRTARHPAA